MRLLEGEVDNRDEIILGLQTQNQELIQKNRQLETEIAATRATNVRAISNLRRQLEPLHNALRMVFGEIEAAGVGEAAETSSSVNPRVASVWESWKQKLPGKRADFIQALLEHEAMTATHKAAEQWTLVDKVKELEKQLTAADELWKQAKRHWGCCSDEPDGVLSEAIAEYEAAKEEK
jgi:hypothetical protein